MFHDDSILFLVGMFLGVLIALFVGSTVSGSAIDLVYSKAIENGCVQYNATTGEREWIKGGDAK